MEQKLANGGEQLFPALDLPDGVRPAEVLFDGLEVLHVRTDDDGGAGARGLDDVMAAPRGDRSANENHMGKRIRASKLADGIEQQDAGQLQIREDARLELGTAYEVDAGALQLSRYFLKTRGLAWGENQQEARKIGCKRLKGANNKVIFIDGMTNQAAALIWSDRARGDPDVLGAKGGQAVRGTRAGSIIFEVAQALEFRVWYNQAEVAMAVDSALDKYRIGQLQQGSEEPSQTLITRPGTGRNAAVHKSQGGPGLLCFVI